MRSSRVALSTAAARASARKAKPTNQPEAPALEQRTGSNSPCRPRPKPRAEHHTPSETPPRASLSWSWSCSSFAVFSASCVRAYDLKTAPADSKNWPRRSPAKPPKGLHHLRTQHACQDRALGTPATQTRPSDGTETLFHNGSYEASPSSMLRITAAGTSPLGAEQAASTRSASSTTQPPKPALTTVLRDRQVQRPHCADRRRHRQFCF